MNEEQRNRERIAAGHELVRLGRKRTNLIQRDIVEMVYDDGLTPKEALEVERQHLAETARDFRQAVDLCELGCLTRKARIMSAEKESMATNTTL
jgi:hypothetical protein